MTKKGELVEKSIKIIGEQLYKNDILFNIEGEIFKPIGLLLQHRPFCSLEDLKKYCPGTKYYCFKDDSYKMT